MRAQARIDTAVTFCAGVFAAVVAAIALSGCAAVGAPKSADDAKAAAVSAAERTNKAIDDACSAALTVCALYEILPPEHHTPEDDATCADARVFCAGRRPAP